MSSFSYSSFSGEESQIVLQAPDNMMADCYSGKVKMLYNFLKVFPMIRIKNIQNDKYFYQIKLLNEYELIEEEMKNELGNCSMRTDYHGKGIVYLKHFSNYEIDFWNSEFKKDNVLNF